MTDGFRGLSEIVDVWRKVRDVDWSTARISDFQTLRDVLDKADEYMSQIEATPATNTSAVDPMPAWTIYAADPDAVSMHRYHKMIAGQRGDKTLADSVQMHLDQVLLWRERNRGARSPHAPIETAKQEDTVDIGSYRAPSRQCNSVKAHIGHRWENNLEEWFWCAGRQASKSFPI